VEIFTLPGKPKFVLAAIRADAISNVSRENKVRGFSSDYTVISCTFQMKIRQNPIDKSVWDFDKDFRLFGS